MKPHQTFLELAAMAIDYPLSASERRHLDEHLAGCQDCVRSASALRADAVAIGSLPPLTLSDRRGDLILAAALRPATGSRPLRLVAIAALLTLLITGSIAVGALLMNRRDDNLSIVVPPPSQTASPDASPLASPSVAPAAVTPSSKFALTRADAGTTWIELYQLSGQELRLAEGSDPRWVSAGQIVYACPQVSPDFLGLCSVDPTEPASWKSLVAEADQPAPAPDGSLIAFHRGTIDVGETWLISPDGSKSHRLSVGRFRAWSPDGAWLAGQPESFTAQVAIIGVDGKRLRVLAPGSDPAWSPAGDRIAFASVDDQGGGSLRTVDVDSGDVTELYAAPAGAQVSEPAWLGDTGWVFVQDGHVWRLDAAGSVPVQLTTGAAIEPGSSDGPLAVSADGRWVAFTTGLGATARAGIASVTGESDVVPLGSGPSSDPRWAPEPGSPAPTPDTPEPSASVPVGAGSLGWTWVETSVPSLLGRPDGVVEAVTAGGPGFVAVGRGCLTTIDPPACEGLVWTSADGRQWARGPASEAIDTGAAFPTSGPELGMYDVAAGTPGVVAIGYAARPDLQATIWFSPDAVNWERIPLGLDGPGTAPDDPMAVRINGVTWDGGQFVVVGEDRSDFNGRNLAKAKVRAAVWTSADGRAWSRVPHTAALDVGKFVDTLEDPATGGMRDVVAGPAELVAVGSVCDGSPGGCQTAAWTSSDGSAWERAPDMPAAAGDLSSVVASSRAGYLAAGPSACDGCQSLAYTSADGRSWQPQAFDRQHDFTTVASINDMLFAIVPDQPTTVWTSDDGQVWLQSAVLGGPTTGVGLTDWQLASSSDTAVWLGSPEDRAEPAAWVSDPTLP